MRHGPPRSGELRQMRDLLKRLGQNEAILLRMVWYSRV